MTYYCRLCRQDLTHTLCEHVMRSIDTIIIHCSATKPGQDIEHGGVTIVGPLNLPSEVAQNASQVYARNASAFLLNMVDKEGNLTLNTEDEIVRDTLVARDGEIVNVRVREVMGLPPLEVPEPEADENSDNAEGEES